MSEQAIQGSDIDKSVFGQITEMDDEDDCDFSSEIVCDYFKQAVATIKELNDALESRDFKTLSSKGHFLKGSSAALGVRKVQDSCEHIQHYGNKRDEVKGVDLTEEQALARIKLILPRLEKDYESAKIWLEKYYQEQGVDLEEKLED
ncbi:histidine phosphotransferase [Rhizoctonia solani]|nr:histidine phosphotransferase [Rhizoctonia solani]